MAIRPIEVPEDFAVSGLWCLAGLQDIWKRRAGTGISWLVIGVAILIAAVIGFIVDHAWSGALIAGVGLLVEARFCVRQYQALKA